MGTTAVVISCFELGEFLEEAVASVLRQSRPIDELIVVDDGSADARTERALTACAAQGICVVRAPHRGVAEARNTGINLTGTDYVVLLDADDIFEPTLIESMAGTLDSLPELGFVTCAIQAFGDASYIWVPPACTAEAALVRGGPHVSSMFRRQAWQAAGQFDGGFEGYEDTDFWMRVMKAGFAGIVLDHPLLKYRVRKGSRYGHALRDDRFMRSRARLREKHTMELGASRKVLLDMFAFVAEQRAHGTDLATRRQQYTAEAERLMMQVTSRRADVQTAGNDPDWGDLGRAEPISEFWGFDRGTPVDRFYIESFLDAHAKDIRGRVVEVKDDGYARRFGRDLASVEVIDIDPSNPHATIVTDLTRQDALPEAVADCFILTQTLHLLFDIPAALASAARLLKPGGVLLCTIPCVSRVAAEPAGQDADCWRLTPSAVEELFWRAFPTALIDVNALGNLKTCAAFLQGVAAEDLSAEDLESHDPSCPLLCTVRVTSDRAERRPVPFTPERAQGSGAVLLYHRIGTFAPDVHSISRRMDAFTADLEWLSKACTVMPLADLIQAARAGALPARAVSLTFDDGYVEHLDAVAPLLARLVLPATFFVNTALLDRPSEQWWDEVERILLVEDGDRGDLDLSSVGGTIISVTDTQSRRVAHDQVFALMYRQTAIERTRLMALLRGWHGGRLAPREPYTVLTSSQLRQLADLPGITIGAHSVNHLALPLHEPGIQLFEASSCKRTLEDLLQRPVEAFAYPYGVHDARTMESVRQAGFRLAVSVEPNPVRCGALPLRIPRFEVGGQSMARAVVALAVTTQPGRE